MHLQFQRSKVLLLRYAQALLDEPIRSEREAMPTKLLKRDKSMLVLSFKELLRVPKASVDYYSVALHGIFTVPILRLV